MAQPIVIGVSTAQTGPAAVAAEWELWGVNLAVEEINAAGGVLGRKLEILVMDNKCNPSEAVNVANKLVEAKVVAIEGSHCSSAHLASMKIIQDAKIPMITGIASNPQITTLSGKGGNDYAFRISASDAGMMQALGIYLADKKPFKTVAIVAEDSDFGRGGADAFKAAVGAQGGPRGRLDRHPSAEHAGLHQHPDPPAAAPAGRDRDLPARRRFAQLPAPGDADRRAHPLHRPHRARRPQPADHRGRRPREVGQRLAVQRPTPIRRRTRRSPRRSRPSTRPSRTCRPGRATIRIRVLAQAIKDANSTDGTKIKDAIKAMSFTNVMGKTVKFDDYNQAGHWVALHTVLNRKVTLADLVEVK